jgi:hypothetical protein
VGRNSGEEKLNYLSTSFGLMKFELIFGVASCKDRKTPKHVYLLDFTQNIGSMEEATCRMWCRSAGGGVAGGGTTGGGTHQAWSGYAIGWGQSLEEA